MDYEQRKRIHQRYVERIAQTPEEDPDLGRLHFTRLALVLNLPAREIHKINRKANRKIHRIDDVKSETGA